MVWHGESEECPWWQRHEPEVLGAEFGGGAVVGLMAGVGDFRPDVHIPAGVLVLVCDPG